MAGVDTPAQRYHHALSAALMTRQVKNIKALTATIQIFTNPFEEESEGLFNFVTKAVMPERVKSDLCNESNIGEQLLEEFVNNRIKSSAINLWAPMRKQQLQTWKMTAKQMKVKTGEKTMQLKEDCRLFSCMLVVLRSRPDINLQETIGKHELSVEPRSMFAADGTMLYSHMKSSLMTIFEKLPQGAEQLQDEDDNKGLEDTKDTEESAESMHAAKKVALVDAMAEV